MRIVEFQTSKQKMTRITTSLSASLILRILTPRVAGVKRVGETAGVLEFWSAVVVSYAENYYITVVE